VAAYLIRSLLVYVWCTVRSQTELGNSITLARSNSALPDYGDYTETCSSCFNVNFNVNFKTVFKTIQLSVSW